MADPVVQPDACTTLTATSALDVWSEHLAKNSNNFFCGNPDCIQLYDRKKTKTAGSESITFEKKEDVCTIEVSVNGKMEERYRFSEDDQIFAASRGSVCPETGTPVVETTHVVCGKCMRAGAHVGIDGVCRAAAAEAVAESLLHPPALVRAGRAARAARLLLRHEAADDVALAPRAPALVEDEEGDEPGHHERKDEENTERGVKAKVAQSGKRGVGACKQNTSSV